MMPPLLEAKIQAQGEMLANRLCKRYRHLAKWARRIGTDVFRLYDRDIPEIPLVLDWYDGSVSGALYERPYTKDEGEEAHWIRAMEEAIAAALDIPSDQIFMKERKRQRLNAQYHKTSGQGFTRDVREGGLRFRVNLSDYLDTGLFPDRRGMRSRIRAEAAGKRILNLFCYTAAFSIYAAAGGGQEIDSVDLSRTYLDWAGLNFGLNGFTASPMDSGIFWKGPGIGKTGPSPYRLIRSDALGFIREALARGRRWDLIILDPPAFSNSKKMETTLDIRRDYPSLISSCLSLLNPGGTLWFSAGRRRLRLDGAEFPQVELRDLGEALRDEDFRGKPLPPCYTLRGSPEMKGAGALHQAQR